MTGAAATPPPFALRLFLLLLGAIVGIGALGADGLRDGEGGLRAVAVVPLATAIALVALAAVVGTRLQHAALWLGMAGIGQAASLRLVNAGTSLHYQHTLAASELWAEAPIATAILVAEAVAVAAVWSSHRAGVVRWLRESFAPWQLVAFAAAAFATSATVSEDVRFYVGELFLASAMALTHLGAVALAIRAVPPDSLASWRQASARWLGPEGEESSEPAGVDPFSLGCALAVATGATVLAWLVYERHPHVQDEVKYLYHARYLAAGWLAMPPPPVPEAFELYLMDIAPRGWYAVTPPGWPAVLAVGVWAGAPWLVNPVLAALNVLAAYALLTRLYPRRTARVALLLLCLSPWFVFLAMGFMAHMLTLLCALLGALGVAWARETSQDRWAWLGGAALGWLSLTRQLDALIAAFLVGLWAIGVGGRRLRVTAVAGLVLGSMLVGALQLPYNALYTGSGLAFPIMEYNARLFGAGANAYGFGPDRGMGWELDPFPGHGPLDAIVNTNLNTTALNVELFGWATGSLLAIYLLVLVGPLRRSDRLMLAVIALDVALYFFNYFSGGPDFGPRYWFLVVLPCAALSARGLEVLGAKLEEGEGVGSGRGGTTALAAAAALCAMAAVTFAPWRCLDKYRHYLDMRPDIRELAASEALRGGLVLIRGVEFPDYASAAIYNPLDLGAEAPIFARDRGAEVTARLLRAFPDRALWIVDGPTRTGRGYVVVESPDPAADASSLGGRGS